MMLARPDLIQGAEIIDITAARGMGDNSKGSLDDYIQKRRQIWAARVPSAVKIIALAIIEHMHSGKLECSASKARLAYMCNMPAKTFERHYNAAKELFYYHERRGKTTVFSPKLLDVAKELAILWGPDYNSKVAPGRYKPSPKMREGQIDPSPKLTLPQNGQTPPQIDLDTPPQFGGPKRQGRDKLEEKEDVTPSDKPRPYSQPFEDFWKKYPRREGKGKAYASWKRLNAADRKNAMTGLDAQLTILVAKSRDASGNFCPHASTWLGQRRWEDDVESPQKPSRARPRDPKDMTPDEYRDYLEKGYV